MNHLVVTGGLMVYVGLAQFTISCDGSRLGKRIFSKMDPRICRSYNLEA